MNEFDQSRWFVRIRARLEDDGVSILERGPLTRFETKHLYRDIPDHPIRLSSIPKAPLVVTVFFGLLFVYLLYFHFAAPGDVAAFDVAWSGVMFGLLLLLMYARSRRVIGYRCSNGPLLFFDKTGDQDPRPFLERIQLAKREHFRSLREQQRAFYSDPGDGRNGGAPAGDGGYLN